MLGRILSASVLALGLTISAGAQQMGQITGVVRDASGGVIPGARVTATEAQTGLTRSAESDGEGRYLLPSLRPTVYSVSVEADGFKAHTQVGVSLLANESATLNVALEIGAVTETITVEGAAAQVDTSTSTIKEVVDQDRVVELPLNGRNAAQLTTLVPGTVVAPSSGVDQGRTKTAPGGVVISSNGSRQGGVSYRLDGGNNQDFYTNINQPFPFPDAVQEFSIQTSNYNAGFGNNVGAVVNVVTRGGTNEYHGTAFGFVRNRSLNAREFFASTKSQLKRSQFGATAGGPVIKNKAFFFVGWQGTELRDQRSNRNAFVPTNDQLAGNFSTCGANCDQVIRDPLGGVFANNQIPVTRFDPASLRLTQNYLPRAGGDGLTFFDGGKINDDVHEGVARGDYQLSDKDRITGRYFIQHFRSAGVFANDNLLTLTDSARVRSQNVVLSETHIFSPTLLNEAHFTYNRVHASRANPVGIPNVNDFGLNIFQPEPKAIQSINVAGFFNFGDNPTAKFVRNGFEFTNQLRWIRGKHNITIGGEVARERVDIVNQFRQPGTFTFTGDVTGLATSDFLLGRLRQFDQGSGEFKNNRNIFFSVFVQDDVKLTSRLTLNLGLRYEPFFPWREDADRVQRFDIGSFQNGVTSQVFLNAPPGLSFEGDQGFPENGAEGDENNFAPRVGFAYDVFGTGKTSIRGGVGVFYDQRQSGIVNNNSVNVSPFSTRISIIEPEGPFSDPFRGRDPFVPQSIPTADSEFPEPVTAVTNAHRLKSPISYNWNLSVEHELFPDWLLRVAYVGSKASNLTRGLQLNPAVFTPGVDENGTPFSSTSNTDARRLFAPVFGNISQVTPDGTSTFHSAQVTLNKRFSRDFTILGNYTWSKSIDNISPGDDAFGAGTAGTTLPFNFEGRDEFDVGNSPFDHTHRFVLSYVWDLPRFASGNGFKAKLLNGWQYTGIFQYQTGDRLTIFSGRDNSLTGIGLDRAVLTGVSSERPEGADPTRFLNRDAFAPNAIGTAGNVGKGRFHGPNLINWDMGIFKNTPINERINTQFRAEFFNTFNRTNFNSPSTNINSGNFGRLLSARDPRIIQLGFKVMF